MTLDGSIPPVIEDSMSVVLALGYRYLWADRYCVSDEADLKHHQIMNMDQVLTSIPDSTLFNSVTK